MAGSSLNPRIHCHARSISLPSRSHPLTIRVEEHLNRLRSSQGTTSSSTSSIICHNLSGLKDLYDCVDDLLQMPLAQQVLAHERHEKWVNEVLDGSVKMLDLCGSSRDVLLQMKESVQELQSSIRRKRGGEFVSYVESRKKVQKAISKKSLEITKRSFSNCLDKDRDIVATIGMLREVEEITFAVFESLLCFFLGPKARSKKSGWSLVSKLMHTKRVACEEEEADFSEVEKVDAALYKLMGDKTYKGNEIKHVQDVQKRLEALELSILDLEEGLECVFRCLIKTRVSLLNTINH